MSAGLNEFVYKLPGMSSGSRPGAHRSRNRGAGMTFAAHARLFDQPDPRRIDIRASLNDIRRDWLVHSSYQRSSININTLVDVSASMQFGANRTKIGVAADFLEALGFSAQRYGDSVGLMAFDQAFREDLYMPARHGRGLGQLMAAAINDFETHPVSDTAVDGLAECVERIAGRSGIVFLLSDFHWPLQRLATCLDQFANSLVVPLVVWGPDEIEAPPQSGLLSIRDAESGAIRRLWLRESLRQQWRDNVTARRDAIAALFTTNDIHPFYISGHFDAEALTNYFLEKVV